MPSNGHQNYLDKSLESYLDIYLNTRRNTEVIEPFCVNKTFNTKRIELFIEVFHGFGYSSEVLYILSQI